MFVEPRQRLGEKSGLAIYHSSCGVLHGDRKTGTKIVYKNREWIPIRQWHREVPGRSTVTGR